MRNKSRDLNMHLYYSVREVGKQSAKIRNWGAVIYGPCAISLILLLFKWNLGIKRIIFRMESSTFKLSLVARICMYMRFVLIWIYVHWELPCCFYTFFKLYFMLKLVNLIGLSFNTVFYIEINLFYNPTNLLQT